jgi:hypothetical protein
MFSMHGLKFTIVAYKGEHQNSTAKVDRQRPTHFTTPPMSPWDSSPAFLMQPAVWPGRKPRAASFKLSLPKNCPGTTLLEIHQRRTGPP